MSSYCDMASPKLKHANSDDSEENVVSIDQRVRDLKTNTSAVDRRESMSAYFTIAAAAAGLISDGCESLCSTFSSDNC